MSSSVSAVRPPAFGAGEAPPPRHVAIIMDGNGRWAAARGLPRQAGQERGGGAHRNPLQEAGPLRLRPPTRLSFSTENWRRPATEVNALFGLLRAYVRRDLERLKKEGVRIRVIGQRDGVPRDIAELIERAERETAANVDFHLTIAFNYGGREEITRAARAAAQAVADGRLTPDALTEARFESFLDTSGLAEPDLLIRTSGECRLSNFLLWQLAYSELVFLDVLWPDFDRHALEAAIAQFRHRERRFGALTSAGS